MDTTATQRPADFYVRKDETDVQEMRLEHVRSEADFPRGGQDWRTLEGATAAELNGNSECLADTEPPVSVGWDWRITALGIVMNRHSIRTNLMLVDAEGRDLGYGETVEALLRRLDREPWQRWIMASLTP